ncbi:hypothetical protein M0R45_008054 [Rubus argutus]|uniref:Uncharacterized protein n=1 Tax=Rubus argutus TaxID=59490 RepID=A0AAW1Y207_RUBAR
MGGKRELIHRSWESLKEICRRHDDWTSYKEACEDDPELKSFDANLQSRTTNVISVLQNQSGAVSTDFLCEVIAYVNDFNQHTVDAIMVCKEDISSGRWRKKKKNKKMNEENFKVVVEEYVNNSEEMLDFCSALDQFLKSARKSHFEIEQVVQLCEIETDPAGGNMYARISEKLKSLKADAHHYVSANDLLQKIQTLQLHHREFLKKLILTYMKLGKKERSARAWRKAVNMIFITAVAAECVTAAVALAVGCAPAVTAISATIAPTMAGRVWAFDLINQYEKRLENEKDILHTMYDASVFAIKELGDVKFLIDKVVKEIDTFLFRPAPNSAIEGQVETAIKNIKTQLDEFLKKIEDLENIEKNCSSEILSSRDKVVRSMKA